MYKWGRDCEKGPTTCFCHFPVHVTLTFEMYESKNYCCDYYNSTAEFNLPSTMHLLYVHAKLKFTHQDTLSSFIIIIIIVSL